MALPPIDTLVMLALIVSLAYAIYGLTGFGAIIAGMPFLLIFIPLHTAAPIMQVYSLAAGSMVANQKRGSADLRELWYLAPFMLLGLTIGTTILIYVPEKYLLLLLGVFLVCYSSWSLFFQPVGKPIAVAWASLFGTAGGIFSAIFGTGGPLFAIFLARRIDDKEVLRTTTNLVLFIAGAIRLLMLVITGFFSRDEVIHLGLLLLPCAVAGVLVGSRLHRRVSLRFSMQATWLVLIVAGITVVQQGLDR
jgi:uncharacterized membrane protein YfcA